MNPQELQDSYERKKAFFHSYIDDIKTKSVADIYTIINSTLIKNPYVTYFPKKFFSNEDIVKNKYSFFLLTTSKFYLKHFFLFITYFIGFLLYKIFYRVKTKRSKNSIGIDIFFLVNNIIKDKELNENYFLGLYEVLDKYNQEYIFIPRLYGSGTNPFKLIKLFTILKKDKRNFLFEYELLSIKDFWMINKMILCYPFKTLRLLQKKGRKEDELFNNELINDIASLSFEAFSRYIFGKNIAKLESINKIYSWSEFQVVERSFNYGIRKNSKIELIACQFYLNYEVYFNSVVDDLDVKMNSAPHKVLVNGETYMKERKTTTYMKGVSLRYKELFRFKRASEVENILLLGSYIQIDTAHMLESISSFSSILFKNHPAVNILEYGKLESNIEIVTDSIYQLFQNCNIVIGTASGSLVEAITCGSSVIIIASKDNLTANPLVKYGKGKIWDTAFSQDDVKRVYNNLLEYRKNNLEDIEKISSWYKENFFIEPTEENILNAFEIDKEKKT